MSVVPRLVVLSLGNPGQYYDCLHSAGHFALTAVQKAINNEASQPAFRTQHYGGKSCRASVGYPWVLVESPMLMNVSGSWAKKAWLDILRLMGCKPSETGLVLVHDDLEEDFGVVKMRKWTTSHRGHNGMKSIKANLKPDASSLAGKCWSHISVGIGRPVSRDQQAVSDYVLRKMTRGQREIIDTEVGPQVLECLMELQQIMEQGFK